jgi:6-pyruvoyl-tetrahydropterin synthase
MIRNKYNFRFNAVHSTSLTEARPHPHTFEVTCYVEQEDTSYELVENQIKEYLAQYIGQYINNLMQYNPTIEVMANTFFNDIDSISHMFNLRRLELSDSPVQTYIIEKERKR